MGVLGTDQLDIKLDFDDTRFSRWMPWHRHWRDDRDERTYRHGEGAAELRAVLRS